MIRGGGNRHHFGVGRHVVQAFGLVGAFANDPLLANDHRPHGYLARRPRLSRQLQGLLHEMFV